MFLSDLLILETEPVTFIRFSKEDPLSLKRLQHINLLCCFSLPLKIFCYEILFSYDYEETVAVFFPVLSVSKYVVSISCLGEVTYTLWISVFHL